MRVYDTVHGAHRILPLSVSMQGQRCRLVVGRLENELPPYRIENRYDPMRFPSAIILEAHGSSAVTPQACSAGKLTCCAEILSMMAGVIILSTPYACQCSMCFAEAGLAVHCKLNP